MKPFESIGCAALTILALTAIFGGGEASATKLYSTASGPLGVGTVIKVSLASGTSAIMKDEFGTTTDTCTQMEGEGKIEVDAGTPTGKATVFSLGGCTHTVDTITVGQLSIKHIPGTTNGEVFSSGTEAKVQSTFFGATCIAKTGTGTRMGTLTGATSATSHPVMHVNANVNAGICGVAQLTGTGTVTSPTGLIVEAE